MPFQIIRKEITKVKADAVVNIVTPNPKSGGGTENAICVSAEMEQLLAERVKTDDIAPGDAVYTDASDLDARYIIHTVVPAWTDGSWGERRILRSCYENSMILAERLKCESIAFPLISTGKYGFPKNVELDIALSEIRKFLLTHELKVILAVRSRKELELSGQLAVGIEEYLDENLEDTLRDAECRDVRASDIRGRRPKRSEDNGKILYGPVNALPEETDASDPGVAAPTTDWSGEASGKSLSEILDHTGDTFQQTLFKLIDASGMDDVAVYKKANIDRKVFSSIRCNANYKPRKKTAVALAIALELDLPTTLDLLSRAGMTFSPSSKFDLIIKYFIQNRQYDIFKIDAALFRYGQTTLGE